MQGSLTIIGAGRVGRALGRALSETGWKIFGVVTLSQPTARRAVRSIGQGHAFAGISRQAVSPRNILIATPDSIIPGIGEELARISAEELKGKTVLHTSGARASDVLEPLRAFGASVGSLHPMQTFSGIGVPPLEGRVFAIEGDPAALRLARQMVRALGGHILQLPASGKAAYHAAASMAAGQVLAVIEAATTIMMSVGIKRRDAVRALLPLTRQVLDNFERIGPRAAWTGPLARGDYEVIAAHEVALRNFPAEFRRAYEQLNRLAARVLSQNPEQTISRLDVLQAEVKAMSKSMGRQG
ncbi:MAG TPA: DUF2520 domain-containing protein [Candidatus Dormibacteraeota bacterium]|jgi:predicted short-subunit dehydrogenase-like oxidoreductase (DUF2520 family)|nr:DUF2520 domain-containing protein [Candidatus Dormibacteraeota bacterium]